MVSTPVGYQLPGFPGLYWPLGPEAIEFQESFLYSFRDIWMFTTIWAVIFMTGMYTCAALIYLFTHHVGSVRPLSAPKNSGESETSSDLPGFIQPVHNRTANIQSYFVDTILSGRLRVSGYIVAFYILMGALQGFIAGSAVGCMIGGIYTSGQFKVTPWIPFTFGLLIALYNVVSTYSFTVQTL